MGVKGAAIATIIVRFIEMFIYLLCIKKGEYHFKTRINDLFRIEKDLIGKIIVRLFHFLLMNYYGV